MREPKSMLPVIGQAHRPLETGCYISCLVVGTPDRAGGGVGGRLLDPDGCWSALKHGVFLGQRDSLGGQRDSLGAARIKVAALEMLGFVSSHQRV